MILSVIILRVIFLNVVQGSIVAVTFFVSLVELLLLVSIGVAAVDAAYVTMAEALLAAQVITAMKAALAPVLIHLTLICVSNGQGRVVVTSRMPP
jgi:hypothetical protein